MFRAAADGRIKIETQDVDIKDIETVWNADTQSEKRLVVRF